MYNSRAGGSGFVAKTYAPMQRRIGDGNLGIGLSPFGSLGHFFAYGGTKPKYRIGQLCEMALKLQQHGRRPGKRAIPQVASARLGRSQG